MGSEIVYCESCGERILEKEIQQGKAITIQNRSYCSNCREHAITENSGEMSRDEFAKTVLPKEPESPAEGQKKSSTSHMRAVRPDQRLVSRAGQQTRRHTAAPAPSRIHGRPAARDGRDRAGQRFPQRSSSDSTTTIWIIVGVVAAVILIVVLLATKK